MDELQEYEAFARLLKQGRKVEEIAATFGVTELRGQAAARNRGPATKDQGGVSPGRDRERRPAPPHVGDEDQQKEWVDVPDPADSAAAASAAAAFGRARVVNQTLTLRKISLRREPRDSDYESGSIHGRSRAHAKCIQRLC